MNFYILIKSDTVLNKALLLGYRDYLFCISYCFKNLFYSLQYL